VASDRKSLPGLEKEAARASNGRMAFGTADAYLGYGDYAKAASLYRTALTKGGVDADVTNTRLGFALGKTGDAAGAEQALALVTGSPRAQLAKYYQIWIDNQSAAKAAAATPAPAQTSTTQPAPQGTPES